jgi:AcrR family transcriptional regulator
MIEAMLSSTPPSKLLPIQPTHRGGEERVTAILDAADRLLQSTALEDFSLLMVARNAGIANATIYHFFPSAEAVLVGLLRRYLESMDAMVETALAAGPAMDWQKLVRYIFEEIRQFYADNPVAARLVFNVGGYGGVQSVDDDHVMDMARRSTAAFQARYHMPLIDDGHRRVAIAIAVSDRIWSMDVQNGCVSDFVFEESQRVIISYLSNYVPPVLVRRDYRPPMMRAPPPEQSRNIQ